MLRKGLSKLKQFKEMQANRVVSVLKKLRSKFLIRVPMLNRCWIEVYKKELGLEYRLDKTHFIEYAFEGFKEELGNAGLHIQDYSIQFGEIWAVAISKLNG